VTGTHVVEPFPRAKSRLRGAAQPVFRSRDSTREARRRLEFVREPDLDAVKGGVNGSPKSHAG
jgi:hypothetical protein